MRFEQLTGRGPSSQTQPENMMDNENDENGPNLLLPDLSEAMYFEEFERRQAQVKVLPLLLASYI